MRVTLWGGSRLRFRASIPEHAHGAVMSSS
jgi:hypothetical protein